MGTSPTRRGTRCRAAVALLALLAAALTVPLLAGCRVILITRVPTVKENPFVGTWKATIVSTTYEYRFASDLKYQYQSSTTSGATTLTVKIAGTYEYDASGTDRGALSLKPSSTTIAAERLKYEFAGRDRDELKLTSTSADGHVTVTLTYRRQ